MARTKGRARKGTAGQRENAKTPQGRKTNQELTKKKRNRDSFNENESRKVDGQENSDTRPLKKAKTAEEPNSASTDHVSQTETSNITISTDKKPDSHSSTKPKPQSDAISEFAPPLYGDIANTHDVTHISVLTSSKIQRKVTLILEKLAQYPTLHPAKPAVIFIHAKAVAASKLITIVEIAKRDIASRGGKWFQYNTIHQVMEKRPRDEVKGEAKKKEDEKIGGESSGADKSTDADGGENEEGEGQEEESFEVMKTPFERAIEGTPKARAVAILGTYLSRVRIEGGLMKKYGEQTNALEARQKSDSL